MSKQETQNKAKSLVDEQATKDVNGKTLSQILDDVNLTSLMGSGAPRATMEVNLTVVANDDWMLEIAQATLDAVYMYQNHIDSEVVTPELLAEYLKWVVLNRVNFLEKGRNEVHPKEVAYPVYMYDALARLMKYDGSVKDGAKVVPTVGDAEISAETREIINNWLKANVNSRQYKVDEDGNLETPFTATSWKKGDKVIAFPGHDNMERLLQVAGVLMAKGLPLTRTSTIRTMYEMDIDTDDYVTSAGQAPEIQAVFARCFYSFKALADLVGVQKVELILYSVLREKLLEVTKSYVKNFRA